MIYQKTVAYYCIEQYRLPQSNFVPLQVLLAVEAPALGGNTLTPTIPEDDTVVEKLLKVKVGSIS